MTLNKFDTVVITGPTATGKTAIGVALARKFNGEIISADSRQVYKGFDLGSGKDLGDYCATKNEKSVPYHLIDITTLDVRFNVYQWVEAFKGAFQEIKKNETLPIIVGGTGLYIDALVRGYTFTGAGGTETATSLIKPLIIGITMERSTLRRNIKKRLVERLNAGLIDEIALLVKTYGAVRVESLGLEARYCSLFLRGEIKSKDELIAILSTKIGQFAKRQETWFRFMEKNGVKIHWLPKDESIDDKILSSTTLVASLMEKNP